MKSVDKGDNVWNDFPTIFLESLNQKCTKRNIFVERVKMVHCNHSSKPAWAQNDAMMEAYIDGMDYGYRVNDDTLLETHGWTEKFINALLSFDPPNVGVVGPDVFGGFTDGYLTYDFTSSVHIDIFGFHYPKYFIDWGAGIEI